MYHVPGTPIAALALGEFAHRAEAGIPALEKALNDRNRLVREAAARALAKIRPPTRGKVP